MFQYGGGDWHVVTPLMGVMPGKHHGTEFLCASEGKDGLACLALAWRPEESCVQQIEQTVQLWWRAHAATTLLASACSLHPLRL